jgi:AraC-like DNA-binding protein
MSIRQPPERIILSAPPALPGVQTMAVENCQPRIWRAYHETFTTCVALKAETPPMEWVYRRKTHLAFAGGLQLMEPGEMHSSKKEVHSVSFRVLMISPEVMQRAMLGLDDRASSIHFKTAQTFDPKLFAAFRDLHRSIESHAFELEQESRFMFCLRLLAQECIERPIGDQPPREGSAGVLKAKALLCESFDRNIGLQELAKVAGISPFYFLQRFKHEFGVPPHAFQIQLKLSSARELLRKGLSIAQTAAHTGFSDQSHFTRVFRRFSGITPKAYVEGVRTRR